MARGSQRHQHKSGPSAKNKRDDKASNPYPSGRKIVETVAIVIAFAGLVFSAYSFAHNFWVRSALISLGLLCLLAIYLIWSNRISVICCSLAAVGLIAATAFFFRAAQPDDVGARVSTPEVAQRESDPAPSKPPPSTDVNSTRPSKHEPPQSDTKPLRKLDNNTDDTITGNRLTDFQVTRDSGFLLEIEVWYVYDGSLGSDFEKDPITVYAVPIRTDGTPIWGNILATANVVVVGHKAIAQLTIDLANPKPPQAPTTTSEIQICLSHYAKGAFYCKRFRYRKVWG
jgi:hypothetical protein